MLQENSFIHVIRLDSKFSTLPNSGCHDPKLSWAAKGLLWYILTQKEDFKIHTWHLASIYTGEKRGNGIEAIRSMLEDLIKNEYMKYTLSRNSKGHWVHSYYVYPIRFSDFQKMFPDLVKPDTVSADTVKPDITVNTKLEKTKQNVVVVKGDPTPLPVEVVHNSIAPEEKTISTPKTVDICKSDVYNFSLGAHKDWSPEEIEVAWDVYQDYTGHISSPFKLIEGIIKNKRLTKKQPREKSCQTKPKPANKTRYPQSEELETTKKECSETVTLGQVFHQLQQRKTTEKKL